MEDSNFADRFKSGLLFTFLLVLAAVAILVFSYPGREIIKRVKYEFTGSEETWKEAAVDLNMGPGPEEYYYDHMPEEYHEAYREIYVRLMRGEDDSEFLSRVSVEAFWDIYYAVLADHPELFWVGNSAQVEESGLTGNVVAYSVETTVLQEDRERIRGQIEAAADEIIGRISPEATDYEKVKAVYEAIIDLTDYDSQAEDSQNIQSVLLNHRSVCAGYSKSFQYILNRMGLFCTYITGKIRDGGDHGWNMIRLDGQYYYVDVTWGDPVFAGRMEHEATQGTMNYNYLCCSETDLFQTHIPGDAVPLPVCDSNAYDYYRMNGHYYELFEYDVIHDALMNSVWNDESRIAMKFGNQEAYETAIYEIFEKEDGLLKEPGEYLMEINGVRSWNYRYHTDDHFYLITIYWK